MKAKGSSSRTEGRKKGGKLRKLLVGAVVLATALLGIVLVRTFLARPVTFASAGTPPSVDAEAAVRELVGAVRERTVSSQELTENPDALDGPALVSFHRYLENTYPLVHS